MTNANNTTMTNAQAFTNIYGEHISFTPFFHNACNVWRVSRNVNSELDEVYENKAFKSLDSCQAACETLLNKQK
ncbi:MAG: hypothetical protein CMJ25_11020 [Phycisphaerae bacterium]|nr:hypothetical protein [Phycisphaerae bacterium]|tara:strand:+ start:280 stop:501 length:222 start_codon:yes stop_codon:yes gene_type:complete